MTATGTFGLSTEARNLQWLLGNLVEEVPGVHSVAVVSSDGLIVTNQHVVVCHVTRRPGVRRARRVLEKLAGPERIKNMHFLMDFEGAREAGDVEDVGIPITIAK